MIETFCELFDFLSDPKEEVRLVAIEHIAGLSLNEQIQGEMVRHPKMIFQIVEMLKEQPNKVNSQ